MLVSYHIVAVARLGWLALWIAAIFNGIRAWEYCTFMVVTAAMIFAMDVLWWATGHSLVRPMSQATTTPIIQHDGAGGDTAATSPENIFRWWVQNYLKEDMDGRVTGNEAYENYAANCRANWHHPESSAVFGKWLTDLADNSGGRIKKIKSGSIVYQGWSLVGGGEHGAIDAEMPGGVRL